MSESSTFTTVSMAEILLVQDLIKEAAEVIDLLEKQFPDDQRVKALKKRMNTRLDSGDPVQVSLQPKGIDRVEIIDNFPIIKIQWELTQEGLDIAKRTVRYSGEMILRLFTASIGPRGVRTSVLDYVLEHLCGFMERTGFPENCVHTGAVGFLGRNGAFIPMASAAAVYCK